jgi:CRP-like cAMP-binding protein
MTVPGGALAGIEALAHLTDDQQQALAACVWSQSFERGAALFRHGDPSREAFAVVAGRAELLRETHFGPFVYAEVAAGELLGEQGFFDHRPRAGDALAASDLETLVIDTDRLRLLAVENPRFDLAMLWAFWRSLARKLRQSNRRLEGFFRAPALPVEPAPVAAGRHDRAVDLASRQAVFAEQRLSPMEVNFLASLSRHERFEAGDVIFREGDPGEALYLVLEGQVMISKLINGAGEEALAFLGRGDYFGEMALIDRERRSATAKAHGSGAVVLEIHRDVVEGLLQVEHASSARLLRLLCSLVAERLRDSDEKLIGFHLLAGGAPIERAFA